VSGKEEEEVSEKENGVAAITLIDGEIVVG
jgi:hypothetical protein